MKCRICSKEECSPFMRVFNICEECYFLARDINYDPTPQDIKEAKEMFHVAIGKRPPPLRWREVRE